MSDSLWPHESQHARPPSPSPTPGVYSNSCPSSQWWHPAIWSSVVPFPSCPQSVPASAPNPSPCSETWLIEQMIIVSDVLTFIMTLVCVVLSYHTSSRQFYNSFVFNKRKRHFLHVLPTSLWFPSPQFSSVQSLSRVWLFETPWIAARQAALSISDSQSSLRLMPIESVMPSSHLTLCHPLLLHPIPPSIRIFSNESTLRISWPKYWSFSFSISPSNEHPGLISFRMDWLDLLAVQVILSIGKKKECFLHLSCLWR